MGLNSAFKGLKGCTIPGGIYRLQPVRYGPTKATCH